jgi:nucleoside-triphosphatase THEP1
MSATAAILKSDSKVAARDREVCRPMLAALVYDEQAYPDDILKQVVDRCRARGLRLAGVVQHRSRESGHRCDMLLEDLATGRQASIFAGRGRGAKGCQLDEYAMLQVVSQIERELKHNPKLLMLNKFGKVEAEGAGMRDLIAQAVWMGIPVIVGVPARNLHAWREFAEGLSIELHNSRDVDDWLAWTVGGAPSDKTAMMDLLA